MGEYAAYIAKVKETEGFKAYKDELALARKKRLKRSVKSAMRKVPMDSSLKRPLSGYMLWFKDARKSIKGKNIAEVSKKAGEMWKGLAPDKKKTYGDRAAEAKKKYVAYVATGKGAAALKAYKEAIAKAKAPLKAGDEKAKAKKAAAKAKAKAKAAAKKEKLKALKEKKKAKAVAAKAAKAAKKAKVTAAAAAKKAKKKAAAAAAKTKKAAKVKKAAAAKAAKKDQKGSSCQGEEGINSEKAAAKKAAKAKKAAAKKVKKATKKAKPSKKAKVLKKKAKKPVKKAKKLFEVISDVSSIPAAAFVGALSCGAVALAMLQFRRSKLKRPSSGYFTWLKDSR